MSVPTPSPEPVTPEPPPWRARTVLRQQWSELAYFHWSYEPEVVQRLLPPAVTVDTFGGKAWVGLIPFEMRRVRLGSTPALPWLGSFIEINVRTYVTDGRGRRAVWFFSLDVPRSLVVAVARSVFALPYCWARATHGQEGGVHRYQMTRRWPRPSSPHANMRFRVGDPMEPGEVGKLDHFLSARWALLTERRGQPRYGRVHHPPWPLHRVDQVEIDQTVLQAAGLHAPTGAPHARYSPGVEVKVAWLEKVPKGTDDT
jgi:uncharacterized protein YqjF (DUF2071 family)